MISSRTPEQVKKPTGEGLGLLEIGWDAPRLNPNRKADLRLAPLARREHPDGEIVRAGAYARGASRRDERGTAARRGNFVRLALRLIVEEALERQVSDALERESYETGEDPPRENSAENSNSERPNLLERIKTATTKISHI